MERRIAAILATDMVEFSRLMEADETGTLARHLDYFDTLISPAIKDVQGRVVKQTGDGLLAEFPSVVDAVRCAVQMQRALADAEGAIGDALAIRYRMAVHLGDIIIEGEDIYGDGVNIAARLEGLADPGGLVVSGTAYDHLKTHVDVRYEDLGLQRLKNIAEPVRAYRVLDMPGATRIRRRHGARPRWIAAGVALLALGGIMFWQSTGGNNLSAADQLDELKARPGVAVMPFQNLSADPEQSYFATGLTEEITSRLSQFSNIRVIARNSASRFGDEGQDLREVSNALGVRYLVQGSVRRGQDRVRVKAYLIDGESGSQIWSADYDERLSARAILDIEETIAASVASNIGGLGGAIRKLSTVPSSVHPDDLAAYDCILVHYKFWDTFDHETHAQARGCLEAAVARHPDFAQGWAELAYTYWTEHAYGVNPQPGSLDRAKAAAERAIELDPNMAEGYGALSQTYRSMKMADEAAAAAERAFAINPNNVGILGGSGCMLTFTGRLERAEVFLDRALTLDPFAPWWIPYCKAIWHIEAGDADAALALLNAYSGPEIWLLGFARTVALIEAGRPDDARTALARTQQIAPDLKDKVTAYIDKNFWALPDFKERLLSALRAAGLTLG